MIQLNLVGIIFSISPQGLQTLKAYRSRLYRYFAQKPDGEEILADLEHHMAEIFWETTEANTLPIQEDLVESMIKRMGDVADFEEAEHNPAYSLSTDEDVAVKMPVASRPRMAFAPYSEEVWHLPTHISQELPKKYAQVNPKRLYRDSKRGILGGIAAGFAQYFQIDVVWVRLLFLAIFLGFVPTPFATGMLVLIYGLLWIALPQREDLPEIEVGKRLYRDAIDTQIGGVCAGLARYFEWQKETVRMAFVLSSVFVVGLAMYAVLWAIMPRE